MSRRDSHPDLARRHAVRWSLGGVAAALVPAFAAHAGPESPACEDSHALGRIDAFAEMVAAGVKELALSPPLGRDQAERLQPAVRGIANRHDVETYLEGQLVVTPLFSADVAAGKDVFLIYRGDTLARYFALRRDSRADEDPARNVALAYRFGRLLSYPDATIRRMLAARGVEDPTGSRRR